MPVDIPVSEEGPSMGGAMLAAVACGEYKSVQEIAEKLVRVKETIEPDKDLVAKYEKKYRQFRQMYPALKPVYDAIKSE
jgi:xylulokinase